jgi:hypothetical protein
LRRDNRGSSPAVLQRTAEAAARLPSFPDAAFALRLAGIEISPRHVGRIAAEIGNELACPRDAKGSQRRRRQLPPPAAAPPEVVAVAVEGGRLRTRQPGCGPGVPQPPSQEAKIACPVNLPSAGSAQDPQPEPPASFVQPRRVPRLVQQMKGRAGGPPPEEAEVEELLATAPAAEHERRTPSAKDRVRTWVASRADSHAFGPMVAAEAQERDFDRARRRAFLGGGAASNWSIRQGYFADFEPITGFLHVLCYVYLAAGAVGSRAAQRWSL